MSEIDIAKYRRMAGFMQPWAAGDRMRELCDALDEARADIEAWKRARDDRAKSSVMWSRRAKTAEAAVARVKACLDAARPSATWWPLAGTDAGRMVTALVNDLSAALTGGDNE